MRWPFLVALAIAVCALGVRYTLLARGATGPTVQTLNGVTGQGTPFELGVRNGRVVSLSTSLSARCAGGFSWRETWSPLEGNPVHFAMAGPRFTTEQRVSPSYPCGIVGEIGFAIRGTLISHDTAQGTIRLVARFYRGEPQWNACDSLDVAWAVGPKARERLKTVPLGRVLSWYYPAVPSLATDVSPARQSFIARVDDTCSGTASAMLQAADAAATRNRYYTNAGVLNDAYYVELHTWQYETLVGLGQPPQARALYDAWLANFRQRVLLERQGVILEARGHAGAAKRIAASVQTLRARGNLFGQEFGLVGCTANGDRTPEPILSDGQPLPLP